MSGEAHRLNNKPRGTPVTIENKSNSFGFREKDGKLLGLNGFTAKFRIAPDDLLLQVSFADRTKYVRIFRREISEVLVSPLGQIPHPSGCG